MASSSEGIKAPADADSSPPKAGEEQGNNEDVLAKPEPKKKKKKMMRFTQQQIDCWIADGDPVLPEVETRSFMENLSEDFLAKLPQHARDILAKMDADREPRRARRAALQEALRKERQDILDEYYSKGYVEYEIDGEDDEAPAEAPRVAHPVRRRFRPGLVKRAGGSTKKLS